MVLPFIGASLLCGRWFASTPAPRHRREQAGMAMLVTPRSRPPVAALHILNAVEWR